MKKVCLAITRMIPGGASSIVAGILSAGRGRYDFTLLTGSEDLPGTLIPSLKGSCRVEVLPSLVRNVRPVSDIRAYCQARDFFRRECFDVVHTHTSKAGVIGRMAAAAAGVGSVIHSTHGLIYSEGSRIQGVPGGPALKILLAMERHAGRKANALCVLSEAEKKIALELRLGTADKTFVIPNGIDTGLFTRSQADRERVRKEFGFRGGDIVLAAAGRISSEKGYDVLVRAFHLLAGTMPDLRLVLAGTGPDMEKISALAGNLRECGRIVLAGMRTDMPAVLSASDIFVHPAFYEGFGLAIAEAMAVGLPVIATDVGGIPETVGDAGSAVIVRPGDVSSLAEAIGRVAGDPGLRAVLGAAGLKRSENFSSDRMLSSYFGLYDGGVVRPAGQVL